MNDWMEQFLRDCIGKLPDSAYRWQVKKELTDHLKTAAEEYEKGGYSPQEARQLALSRMGDPSELARTFQKEALRRQPVDVGHCVVVSLAGCLIAGGLYILTFLVMAFLLGYHNVGPILPMVFLDILPYELASALLRGIYGLGMFLPPFLVTARFLARDFHGPRQSLLVTCGLWLAWLGEKLAILLIGGWVYGCGMKDLHYLVHRISYGGDYAAPWFTFPYILLTFAACPLLAIAASRRESAKESQEKRLA